MVLYRCKKEKNMCVSTLFPPFWIYVMNTFSIGGGQHELA